LCSPLACDVAPAQCAALVIVRPPRCVHLVAAVVCNCTLRYTTSITGLQPRFTTCCTAGRMQIRDHCAISLDNVCCIALRYVCLSVVFASTQALAKAAAGRMQSRYHYATSPATSCLVHCVCVLVFHTS
jgi:hypothetical protein